ncbi:hypothetical protein BD413DRAFT_602160 [Trametes elegans]|nr:hypothetical protein BD413DRAFT_602160 [Trametes elegans]
MGSQQRQALQEPALPQNVAHDPEFWFEDGSIVLVAYNIGFRVYQRILTEHSPFFRDLFRIPQPDTAMKIEGCPVVVLMDPPPQLKHLLRVLYPTSGNLTFGAPRTQVTMDAVASVARLSHKYQIDQLFAQALALFMEQYTDNFDEWIKPNRPLPIAATDLDAISAINIARLTNTPSILPLAFLSVGRAGSAVLRGCLRDGACAEGLTFEDVARALDGRTAFLELSSKAVARIFVPEISGYCTEPRRCARILALKAGALEDSLGKVFDVGAACSFVDQFEAPDPDTGLKLCEKCREMLKEREYGEQQDLWNELPQIFDVTVGEGWSVG